MRVNGGGVRLGVTEQRLADRDVFGGLVRPRAETVTEAMPAEPLALGYETECDGGWLDEIGIQRLPWQPFSFAEAKM
jgi:hypothetical protein